MYNGLLAITTERGHEPEPVLCDAWLEWHGYLLCGDRLWQITTVETLPGSRTRWTLGPPLACEWSIDRAPFIASA